MSQPIGVLPASEQYAAGVWLQVEAADYHHHPAVSKSDLDHVARSPSHYRYAKAHPSEPTDDMRFGTAVHTAVLEPESWEQRYAVPPKDVPTDRRLKGYKDWKKSVEEERPDVEIITREQMEACFSIADALGSHPIASRFIGPDAEGPAEASVFWNRDVFVNHEHGTFDVQCRCRPDKLPVGMDVCVDLKTSRNAGKEAFARDVIKFRYHVAAAWYLAGLRAVGAAVDDYLFVVVENTPPYEIALYTLPLDLIEHAQMLIEVNLHRYALCMATQQWPGYPEEVQELEFPPWAYRSAA